MIQRCQTIGASFIQSHLQFSALSGITAASLGSFVGGVLTRKIKMTPQTTMKMLIILFCGNIIVSFIGLFIGCDQPILAGDGGQQ